MKHVLAVLTALLLIPAHAMAGDEPVTMDDMVVTATRSEESAKTLPAKIEVLDSQDIALTVGDTLTEQLKKNASIGVIEYPGALAGIGIRGFRPEFSGITKHSLILIDGRPAGATNLATLLTDQIERIEVLKGPASSLYGAEAMGGVVNIITKKSSGPLSGSVEAGVGSFKTNFQKVTMGGGITDRLDFDISARRYEQADDLERGNGEERANTSYSTRNADMRVGMDLGDNWRMDLGGEAYQGRDIETPGDTFDGDSKPGQKDLDRWGVDFNIGGKVGTANQLDFTLYATEEKQESYKRYNGGSLTAPYRSYDSDTSWLGFQAKDTFTKGMYKLIVGLDYQDIEKVSRSYNTDGSRKAPYSPDEDRKNLAGYVENVFKLMDDRLTFTVGGRYDTFKIATVDTPYKTNFTPNEEDFNAFSPRAGANYLFDTGIRLHATAGKAFVPPSAWQLAGYSQASNGNITKGNPNLDPESSVTLDGGIGYSKSDLGLDLDLTYFHTDVDDKIIGETIGTTKTYQNGPEAQIRGLEYMASFDLGNLMQWDSSLALFVNGTWIMKAEQELSTGGTKDTHNVADHTVNYGVTYDNGLIDAKLNARYQGSMKDTDWNAVGYPEIEYPSFTVVDLVMGVSFLDHHRVSLKVDNILDKDYYEKKGYPKPGRSFFLSYAYRF